MRPPSKKPVHPDSELLDAPVSEYLLHFVPQIQTLLKAADVSAAFPPVKRRVPDQKMVGAIVNYINTEAPFHRQYAKRPFKKSALLDPFWKALRAVERASIPVLESLRWQRELYDDEALGIPESERSEIVIKALSERDAEIERLRTLLEIAQLLRASLFPSTYGRKRVRWHQAASALVPLIGGAYRAAGCNKVDFQTPTAPGVTALQWAGRCPGLR